MQTGLLATTFAAALGVGVVARADDVSQKAADTAKAAQKYAEEKKDEFAARMQSRLDEAGHQLDKLKASAEHQGKKAKAGLKKQIDELNRKSKDTQRRLGELKKSSGDAWKKLRAGVESAVDELDDGLRKATN